MNKSDLITKIATEANITKDQATTAWQAAEHGITEALANGETVQLVGFASFTPVQRQQRKGRNPKTGEKIIIPAKTDVKFKAGKGLKTAIN